MTFTTDAPPTYEESYRYYLDDGLYDILAGLLLLLAGLYSSTSISVVFVAMGLVIGIPMWRAARKSIVYPRLHNLTISLEQHARARKVVVLIGLTVAASLLLAFVADLPVSPADDTGRILAGGLAVPREYLLLLLGLMSAIILCVGAWIASLYRLYCYAVLTLIIFGASLLIDVPFSLPVAAMGLAISLWGLVMLIRFVRKYPRQES